MATVNFYLKPEDSNGQSPVMLFCRKKKQTFKYYTKIKVNKLDWVNQRVKVRKQNDKEAKQINMILDDLESLLKGIEREAIFQKKDISLDEMKNKFMENMGELIAKDDFFKAYDKFIEDNRHLKTPATIQTYVASKVKFQNFENKYKMKLTFDNIDQRFYENFVKYLIEDLKMLNNTVGKHIKTLKVFLRYAFDNGYTNKDFNLDKFKVFREDAETIYLNESELMKMYHLKGLPDYLERVKDNFCFGCFTGLRFSDIEKMRNIHVKEGFIELKSEKTKSDLRIPLSEYALEILAKYKNFDVLRPLPTCISNQKTNEFLKQVGKEAELFDFIQVEKFSGSKRIIEKKQKFEFLCTHTARRTFVTLSLEKGLRPEVVMEITGHKNYKTFQKYIKITDKVKMIEMNRVWNQPKLLAI